MSQYINPNDQEVEQFLAPRPNSVEKKTGQFARAISDAANGGGIPLTTPPFR